MLVDTGCFSKVMGLVEVSSSQPGRRVRVGPPSLVCCVSDVFFFFVPCLYHSFSGEVILLCAVKLKTDKVMSGFSRLV